MIHALLDKWCGSAGASASVNKCVLGCVSGTAQLIDEDLAGLYGGWAAVGDRYAPRAEESLVGVLAQPGRTPGLILDLCEMQPGEKNTVGGHGLSANARNVMEVVAEKYLDARCSIKLKNPLSFVLMRRTFFLCIVNGITLTGSRLSGCRRPSASRQGQSSNNCTSAYEG